MAKVNILTHGLRHCYEALFSATPAGDPHGTTVYRGLKYAHIVNTPSSRRRPGSRLCSESLDPGLRRDDEKAASGSGLGCGLAMSLNRAGENPALVTASHRPSI
jgi:hypothetical protein